MHVCLLLGDLAASKGACKSLCHCQLSAFGRKSHLSYCRSPTINALHLQLFVSYLYLVIDLGNGNLTCVTLFCSLSLFGKRLPTL